MSFLLITVTLLQSKKPPRSKRMSPFARASRQPLTCDCPCCKTSPLWQRALPLGSRRTSPTMSSKCASGCFANGVVLPLRSMCQDRCLDGHVTPSCVLGRQLLSCLRRWQNACRPPTRHRRSKCPRARNHISIGQGLEILTFAMKIPAAVIIRHVPTSCHVLAGPAE